MGIFAKDAFVANRHGKGGTHSHSIRGWLVRDATKPVPYEVFVCMVPPDESLPCTVLPFDTSWLIEPTTGVHQFGGGSYIRYEVGPPALRSCETAVTSCAGANGLVSSMLSGTPFEAHSSPAAPVM